VTSLYFVLELEGLGVLIAPPHFIAFVWSNKGGVEIHHDSIRWVGRRSTDWQFHVSALHPRTLCGQGTMHPKDALYS
jgi:hypothetical protein